MAEAEPREELGFEFNPEYSDGSAACMVVDQNIFVMLLVEDRFKAIAAGGRPWKPVLEEGPVYGGSFQDPDGHVWELMYMGQQWRTCVS